MNRARKNTFVSNDAVTNSFSAPYSDWTFRQIAFQTREFTKTNWPTIVLIIKTVPNTVILAFMFSKATPNTLHLSTATSSHFLVIFASFV